MFIMHGILSKKLDSFFSTDDGRVFGTQANGKRVRCLRCLAKTLYKKWIIQSDKEKELEIYLWGYLYHISQHSNMTPLWQRPYIHGSYKFAVQYL
jgi:hypothetical protein